MNSEFDIFVSEIKVFEEFNLVTDEEKPTNQKTKKKYIDPIIITPKINKNKGKKIINWYKDNREDVNLVFTEIIDIFYDNNIIFTNSEEHIYDKFVEYMFKQNV